MNPICKQLYAIIPKKIALASDSINLDKIEITEPDSGSNRSIEHSMGRRCAIKALALINVEATAIASGKSGEPIWPKGTVGSISHSKGHCLTAVARQTDFLTLGVDVEHFNRMKERSIERIVHPLESISVGKDIDLATLVFSLKEAFYKAQFPVYKTHLNFKDVALRLTTENQSAEWVWTAPKLGMNPEDYPHWKFHYACMDNRCYVVSHRLKM